MDSKKITYKNKNLNSINKSDKNINETDMQLINELTLEPLSPDDVYTFEIELCDNDVDRVGDKMSNEFLNEVASSVKGLTGLKDHDWSSDNQMSRIYDASVEVDDTHKTKTGEDRRYVKAKVFTLKKFQEYIDKIASGLLKECSISFESEGDTCNICGAYMEKVDDVGVCKNGHVAGEVYDGTLCYNSINHLKDVLEFSLVAVPCQHRAGIKNKNLGGFKMRKLDFLLSQFMNSKAYEKADTDEKLKIEEALNTKSDEEMSEDDIKKIIQENVKLREKVKGLEARVKEAEDGRARDKIEAIVADKIDKMHPLNDKVKECFMKELPWDSFKLEEDGQIPGMEDVFNNVLKGYKGLFVDEADVEAVGGHDEPDGDEAAVVSASELNTSEEPDGDEGKIMITKSSKVRPGVTLKSNTNAKNNKVKPGIYFK